MSTAHSLAQAFLDIPFPGWLVNAGKDYEDGGWMQWSIELPVSVAASSIYVASVFLYKAKFQPPQGAKTQYPKWVRPLAAVHFGFLAVWSVLMFIGMLRGFLEVCVDHGFDVCMDLHKDGEEYPKLWNKGVLLYWFMMFTMSKYYELFDTVFQYMKGYDVILLHWYHHATVPILCYFHYVDHTATAWTGSIFNVFVHTIMYSYYALKELKFNIINPQVVTTLQLIQFVSVTAHIVHLCLRHGYMKFYLTFSACFTIYVSFFFLFVKFFWDRYVAGRHASSKKVKKVD